MAREHIYVRADKKAYVVAFRQVENKKRPRVYETFNFKKCGGKENALAKAQLYHSQQMAKQARGMTTAAKVTATFEEAANRWHKHGLAKGWRKSTATDYRSVLDFRLIPAFGHLQLPRLTEPKVEDWLEEIRPQVSARTVHKLLFIASAVMKRAAKDYPGFEGNPFAAVDAGTTSDHSDHPWFSDEEVWAIIRAASRSSCGRSS